MSKIRKSLKKKELDIISNIFLGVGMSLVLGVLIYALILMFQEYFLGFVYFVGIFCIIIGLIRKHG